MPHQLGTLIAAVVFFLFFVPMMLGWRLNYHMRDVVYVMSRIPRAVWLVGLGMALGAWTLH